MRLSLLTCALAALSCAGTVQADAVYRWVDKDGVVHYTDKPPKPDAKPHTLPPIQTVSPFENTAPASGGSGTAEAASAGVSVRVVSPGPEETLRNDDGRLTVSLALDQPLAEGQGILYLLDGGARNNAPTRNLSYTLEGVERGTHLVSASVVDTNGRELGRAAPVIVHFKPPTVDMAPKRPNAAPPPPRPTPAR